MRSVVTIATAAVLLLPAAPAAGAERTPEVRIEATFRQDSFLTVYQVRAPRVSKARSGRARFFHWTFTAPKADPGCRAFSTATDTAYWRHSDQVCDHAKEGPRGHAGVVRVSFQLGRWRCRIRYMGTVSGLSNGVCALRK